MAVLESAFVTGALTPSAPAVRLLGAGAGEISVGGTLSAVGGEIASDLVGAGEPAEGADRLEIRATTVSGDIDLRQR